MASSGLVWVPFILQIGACILLFFVILGGVNYTSPLNETFFISAEISSFNTNINSPTGYGHWTLWGICGSTPDGKNINCMEHTPAYPFDPAGNFGTNRVPEYFVDHRHFFYYTSRFMFAFFLITITFAVFSVFTSLLALFSRLGSAVSSIFAAGACIFDIIATSLMTAVFVEGRNHFLDAGIPASLGVKAFGFAWGSVGCLLIASLGFCCAACVRGRREHLHGSRTSRFWRRRKANPPATY